MKNKQGKKKKLTPKRVFLYTLGLGVIGGAVYLGRQYYKRKAQSAADATEPKENATTSIFNIFSSGGDSFPLKRGSKGPRVSKLQQALQKLVGQDAMAKFGGIDGVFGSGTEGALKLAGFGKTVSEAMFHQIVNNIPTVVFDPQSFATKLSLSAGRRRINEVVGLLQQIKDATQYSAANEAFKRIGFVSRTIVTHLLDLSFAHDENAKQQIRAQFLRIGLKLDPTTSKWSLQGFAGFKDIVTLIDTYVVDQQKNKLRVKRNTILGDEKETRNGMTLFRALDNSYAAVPSDHVKYVD